MFLKLLICFYLFTVNVYDNQKVNIKFIEVLYIDWNIEIFNGHLPLKYFFKNKKYPNYEKLVLTDSNLLINYRKELLQNNSFKEKVSCDDYRIVCKVNWDNGVIDTLAFGNCEVMFFNGKYSIPKLKILKIIIPFLKSEYRYEYLLYIKEMQKLYNIDEIELPEIEIKDE
ncbi:MAG: hypothetical protein NT007_02760 [Candidatus Kapabacteria bacterium]|nr:hypothetical protein [Candidatus Kapabacteria bacterium]